MDQANETLIIKKFIVDKVIDILLASTFADNIHATDKISDLIVFGDDDIALIKQGIAKTFRLNISISQDISNYTVEDLCNLIYTHVKNSSDLTKEILNTMPVTPQTKKSDETEPHQTKQNKSSGSNDKLLLNSHQVYGIVLTVMGDIMNRRIFPTECVTQMKKELSTKVNFDQLLTEQLQKTFNAPIKITTEVQDTTTGPKPNHKIGVYSIANQTMEALINCGKALPPEIEFAGMTPLWIPLYKSMTFDTVTDILLSDFGIWTSVKTISKLKSFAEFDKYVSTLAVKNKVNKIVFKGDPSVTRQSMSDVVIPLQDVAYIRQSIQKVSGVTVDYDISGTKLSRLYKYIYKKTTATPELRYKLFDKTYQEPQPFELKATREEILELRYKLFGKTYKEARQKGQINMITREDIFAGIIHRVSCAVSVGRSVQGYTNMYELSKRLKTENLIKYRNLQTVYADLESIGISIDQENEQLRLRNICDAIHKKLIERGISISTRISREEMDPVWGALNPTINFDKLQVVLMYDMGINVSVDKLMNCRTYQDYENLISVAQLKKAKQQSK